MEKKPSNARIETWFLSRFPHYNIHEEITCGNFQKWVDRFDTPREIWGASDNISRKHLKKIFPKTFGKLNKTDNLYNKDFGDKYKKW